MDNEEYRHALGLIEQGSPTKGKSALDAAVRKAYDIGRLEGQEEGRLDQSFDDHTRFVEAAKQEERKQIAKFLAEYRDNGNFERMHLLKAFIADLERGERPKE